MPKTDSLLVDDDLLELRRTQRRDLRSIPQWVLEKRDPGPLPKLGQVFETDHVLVELGMRNQAAPYCAALRTELDVWFEVERDIATRQSMDTGTMGWDLTDGLQVATGRLQESVGRIASDVSGVGDPIAALVPLLIWADDAAGDGYVDSRVARRRT